MKHTQSLPPQGIHRVGDCVCCGATSTHTHSEEGWMVSWKCQRSAKSFVTLPSLPLQLHVGAVLRREADGERQAAVPQRLLPPHLLHGPRRGRPGEEQHGLLQQRRGERPVCTPEETPLSLSVGDEAADWVLGQLWEHSLETPYQGIQKLAGSPCQGKTNRQTPYEMTGDDMALHDTCNFLFVDPPLEWSQTLRGHQVTSELR